MDGRPRRRAQHGWTAWAIAVGVNLLAWRVLDEVYLRSPAPPPRWPWSTRMAVANAPVPAPPAVQDLEPTAIVLVDDPVPALTLEAILGPEDAARFGQGRLRPHGAELPGARPADRGGGAAGGVATWTERRDRATDAALRSQLWSSDEAYRTPRADDGRVASTPEAVTRRADQTYGDREPRPRARD
ncbi:MAG TPA: hypothetical protein VHE35_13895, partial [Kofleriaceae bacterium]|nr:hypothetical protein [Kofleriaceae bacterium]